MLIRASRPNHRDTQDGSTLGPLNITASGSGALPASSSGWALNFSSGSSRTLVVKRFMFPFCVIILFRIIPIDIALIA